MGVYKRGGVWWVRFQWDKAEIRRSSRETSRDKALEFELKLKEDLKRVHRGGKPRVTYREAMEMFVEEHLPNLAETSRVRYLTSGRALYPHFIDCYLDEINKAKIAEFVRARKREGVKAAGINRDIACLSSMLSRAAEADMIDANPMKGMPRLRQKEPPGRVRYLTRTEFDRLCAKASEAHRRMIVFAVETGLRFEEQFGLTWDRVDLVRNEIHVLRTKNGTARTVPLEPPAIEVLKALKRHIKEPWVFWHDNGERYVTVREAFGTAVKKAKVKDFTWHDLRHTFASWKAQAGIDMYRLQQLLGHKRPEMTQRYAHLRTDDLRAELERVRYQPRTEDGTHSKDNVPDAP